MKKFLILFIISIFILTGCENKDEKTKSEYIAVKSNLLSATNYIENLPLDIIVSIDRIDEEQIFYKVLFQNPIENMYQMKAMVVHNYNNQDVFPSIGVFDETKDLLLDDETNSLELHGTIASVKNISELDLKLKVWIEYQNDDGEKRNIY